jgi:hypothetical protein
MVNKELLEEMLKATAEAEYLKATIRLVGQKARAEINRIDYIEPPDESKKATEI